MSSFAFNFVYREETYLVQGKSQSPYVLATYQKAVAEFQERFLKVPVSEEPVKTLQDVALTIGIVEFPENTLEHNDVFSGEDEDFVLMYFKAGKLPAIRVRPSKTSLLKQRITVKELMQ